MREILFRGQTEAQKKWVFGDLLHSRHGGLVWIDNHEDGAISDLRVIPETVGQFIGLTDKNGKKIFEGDIVTMPSYGGGKHKTVVYFNNGKFAVDGSNYNFKDIYPRNMEVIGNIHDNPELLEVDI